MTVKIDRDGHIWTVSTTAPRRPTRGTPIPRGPTRLELNKPVIAAVEGPAEAGGMELAPWCDVGVVARDGASRSGEFAHL